MISKIPLIKRYNHIFCQAETWKNAKFLNGDFFYKYREELKKIRAGCSFAPEEFDKEQEALAALRFIVEQLKIKNIRLGIRWKKAVGQSGKTDTSFYDPYIAYCIKKEVNICLNVGPIKTFRWPEDHVPDQILKKLNATPGKGSIIKKDSHLAQEAVSYLYELLSLLTQKYKKEDLAKIRIIQPENEAFNSFGEHRWIMSEEYLMELVKIIHKFFPHVSILLNSAGYWDLGKISGFYERILMKNPKFKDKLISGFDYYYLFPPFSSIPLIGKLDLISINKIFTGDDCALNIKKSREAGFKIEITEVQMEPWGKFVSPGASARELRFVLLRCINNILDPEGNSVVRLWGIELLVKKILSNRLTAEEKEIVNIIKKINSCL
ncbi:MAG: hypothetical protein A2905_00195 [Candidatus Levybacteria bacterium RIFCSPLOWO2_01_FULL_36_10]|nr:MAG: hypothetical protein A2905_00195 [Candidatus Levybacteria bacterium RIFCSPLOWO2_01_FULL_36_10]